MVLSDQACEELTDFFMQLVQFVPPQMRGLLRASRSGFKATILANRGKIEDDVLVYFHEWLHKHKVEARMPAQSPEELQAALVQEQKKIQEGFEKLTGPKT
ncbi:hypothetical protein HY572_00980 [Candidatus Micrarchaeota archaeon]|nr:hypothetical protein [Candidatus Micrarchaeota archaeon]